MDNETKTSKVQSSQEEKTTSKDIVVKVKSLGLGSKPTSFINKGKVVNK